MCANHQATRVACDMGDTDYRIIISATSYEFTQRFRHVRSCKQQVRSQVDEKYRYNGYFRLIHSTVMEPSIPAASWGMQK